MFPDVHHPRTPRWKMVNVFIISAIAVFVISMGTTISQIVSEAQKPEVNIKSMVLLSISLTVTLTNIGLASIGIYYPLLCALYSLIITGPLDIILGVVLILNNVFALSILPSVVILLSLYTAIDELKRANHVI